MFQAQGGVSMPTISRRREDGRVSAIIRNYQPSRIERELLAQVYDLAGRGIEAHSTCVVGSPALSGHVDNEHAAESLQRHILDQSTHQEVNELEAVA
jgi:hypothetical protein